MAAADAQLHQVATSTPGRRARCGCRPRPCSRCSATSVAAPRPRRRTARVPQRSRRQLRPAPGRQPRAAARTRADDVPHPSRSCPPTRVANRRRRTRHGHPRRYRRDLGDAPPPTRPRRHGLATRNVPERLAENRHVRFGGSVAFGWLSNDFGPDGHIGDPTGRQRRARRPAVRRRGRRRRRRAARDRRLRLRTMTATTIERCGSTAATVGTARGARRGRRVDGPNGARGVARLALTDADRDGRDSSSSWMRDLGLAVTIDAIGNVIATYRAPIPALAPVMIGSHIDTVATGGRFDGNLGVLAGLEVIETLATARDPTARRIAGRLLHRRGGRPLPARHARLVRLRRRAAARSGPRRPRRRRGPARRRTRSDRLRRPHPCPAAAFPRHTSSCTSNRVRCWRPGITIGAVTGVQGISWSEWTIEGRRAHAGTTPMRLRRDPMVVAAAVVGDARRLTAETVGRRWRRSGGSKPGRT